MAFGRSQLKQSHPSVKFGYPSSLICCLLFALVYIRFDDARFDGRYDERFDGAYNNRWEDDGPRQRRSYSRGSAAERKVGATRFIGFSIC